ncbi:MAG: formylglycine-generating enzyme family protein [Phycisphaerae bacterium]|nr:formylglycine-generating enzyme family protein [Phycisphaerae bacterium]MCQ3922441.1 hypothetical protein [Planctomycetota bacterium]NUQ10476.1 formylglycine-generating enzyme family protein [Phycisphaerae bacterium]
MIPFSPRCRPKTPSVAACAACLVAAACFSATARAAEPPAPAEKDKPREQQYARLAVLDFRTGDQVTVSDGVVLADTVRGECHKAGRIRLVDHDIVFDLMDREMMKETLSEKDWAATTECDQVRCLVKIGRSLDVSKMVGGFVANFGGERWVLTIRLVDVNTQKQERYFNRDLTGGKAALLDLAREGARELLGVTPEVRDPGGRTAGPQPEGRTLTLDLGGGVTMELVRIEAGSFQMGSNDGDSDEKPMRSVRISKPFYLGKTEVTQAQWKAVMGNDPSFFKGDDLPVEQVSWDDAREFCRKLSLKVRREIRLPTEAEWEYACRAGGTGKWCFGDREFDLQDYAWYGDNAGGKTHPVGTRKPNAWGLYDMHGNVWEWCQDWYGTYATGSMTDPGGPGTGEGRVLRGGSWLDPPSRLRSAFRIRYAPDNRYFNGGFRVASGT